MMGGNNAFSNMLRQACQLGPDGLDFVLQAIRVMLVEYPVMTCACRLGEDERSLRQGSLVSQI